MSNPPPTPDPDPHVERGVEQDGRAVVGRAELVTQLRTTEETLARLYSRRALTGHPAAIGREGRRLLRDRDEVHAWWAARVQAKQAGLTVVDRSGDPEELVDVDEAARVLGYGSAHISSGRMSE